MNNTATYLVGLKYPEGIQHILSTPDLAEATTAYRREKGNPERTRPVILLMETQTVMSIAEVLPTVQPDSDQRTLADIGNELHDLGAILTHSEEGMADHLASLAGELWQWKTKEKPE